MRTKFRHSELISLRPVSFHERKSDYAESDWSEWRDSNSRQLEPKTSVLPLHYTQI